MIIFLPYADIKKSVKCLDDQRLGKQRIEAKQVIYSLISNYKWSNHPASKMFSHPKLKYLGFVIKYYNYCLDEWIARGKVNNMDYFSYHYPCCEDCRGWMADKAEAFGQGKCLKCGNEAREISTIKHPWYWGWKQFHYSHQASLFRKHPFHYIEHFSELDKIYLQRGYIWPTKVNRHSFKDLDNEDFYAPINYSTSKFQSESQNRIWSKTKLLDLFEAHHVRIKKSLRKDEIYQLAVKYRLIDTNIHPLIEYLYNLPRE